MANSCQIDTCIKSFLNTASGKFYANHSFRGIFVNFDKDIHDYVLVSSILLGFLGNGSLDITGAFLAIFDKKYDEI